MAENLSETLKPFFDRALQAEERLTRLEAALATSKTDSGNTDLLAKIGEMQSMLEEANRRLEQKQRRVEELTTENEKYKYRMEHLVRALRAADEKLERMQDETTTRVKDIKI